MLHIYYVSLMAILTFRYVLPQKRRSIPGLKRQQTPTSLPISTGSSKPYLPLHSNSGNIPSPALHCQSSLPLLDDSQPPGQFAVSSPSMTAPSAATTVTPVPKSAPSIKSSMGGTVECLLCCKNYQ